MSMTILTILQIAQALSAYTLVTCVFPAILLHKRLAAYKMSERLIGYFLAGNFYIIYLVFLLQFLHISHPITLQIGTIAPFFPIIWKKRKNFHIVSRVSSASQLAIHVLRREVGVKTLIVKGWKNFNNQHSDKIKKWLVCYLPDLILTIAIIVGVFYVYGVNTVTVFGYKASDVPVHNLWINEMDNNNIFANGVYPHGFHCVIYYLHATFGIKTYILLRVFSLVQTLFVHLALLVSLKVICKVRFTPYIGTAAYLMLNIYNSNSFERYSSTLPQEYGMLFIFPAGVLAIRFFQEYAAFQVETDENKKSWMKKRIKDYLVAFAASFSLTLTVHFYNTMPTGILCLGIAVGFCFRFCKWRYFWRIILTGILSVMLAVLPMAIGVVMGHPLQGSLYWGLNVINGTANKTEEGDFKETVIIDKNGNEIRVVGDVDEEVLGNIINGEQMTDGEESSYESQTDPSQMSQEPKKKESKVKQLLTSIKNKFDIILIEIQVYCTVPNHKVMIIMVLAIVNLILLGAIALVLKKNDYGGMIWSIGFYMLFMCLMQSLPALGLPELMQPSRVCIFFCYSLGLVWALNADAFLYLVFGWIKRQEISHIFSGAMLAIVSVAALLLGLVRTPVTANGLETNEAIICLTNIMHENKKFNWTIVSADDEHQMLEDDGRHYEMITFLKQLMNLEKNPEITLPTEYVYFFIEKQPINYAGSANGIDLQPVSEEGAKTPINIGGGISAYTADARWSTMSHMYYWAQAFMKLYPNEMKVYYETDDFVCYYIHQNVECLYNLAIDYGYNNPKEQEEE